MAARLPQLVRDLCGAVVLGVATILVPKAKPDDHWSASPVVQVDEASAEAGAGGEPPVSRARRRRATAT